MNEQIFLAEIRGVWPRNYEDIRHFEGSLYALTEERDVTWQFDPLRNLFIFEMTVDGFLHRGYGRSAQEAWQNRLTHD